MQGKTSPWGEIEIEMETDNGTTVKFSSGIIIIAGHSVDYVSLLKNNLLQTRAFKEELQRGNYYFYEAMFNTSTKDLRILGSKKQVTRTFWLLMYKIIIASDFEPEYYKFKHNNLRGFMFLESKPWHRFFLYLFQSIRSTAYWTDNLIKGRAVPFSFFC